MMLFLYKNQNHVKLVLVQSIMKNTKIASCFHLKNLIFGLSTASIKQEQVEKPAFIVNYLMESCGFSLDEAMRASKKISHIKAATKPDSVIDLLKRNGFLNADIKSLIAFRPQFLLAKVEKTLEPKLQTLKRFGISECQLVQLVVKNPHTLMTKDADQKLETLKNLVSSNDELVAVCSNNLYLFGCSLQRTILPNLSLLRESGIDDNQIGTILRFHPRMITYKNDVLREQIDRAKKLAVSCTPRMFVYVLCAVDVNRGSVLKSKIELLKSFGWSDEDVLSAIQKSPSIIRISEERLRAKMGFYLKEMGCDPLLIAHRPTLLTYSLTKKLIPRWRVIQDLKIKGLLSKNYCLTSVMSVKDELFLKKYVAPYVSEAPGVLDTYNSAYGKPVAL